MEEQDNKVEEKDVDAVDWEKKALALQWEKNKLVTALDHERQQAKDAALVVESERNVEVEKLQYELEMAREKNRQMELELAAMEVLREENGRLSETVYALQEEVSELFESHAAETHTIKKDAFNSRMQLEKTFRKALQEMDRKHHEAAFKEMDEESKNALIEKARVQDELALQTIGIDALTNRYLEQSKQVQVLKTDNSILKEYQIVQTRKLTSLKQDFLTLENRARDLEEELEETRKKATLAESLQSSFADLKREHENLKKLYGETETKNSRYKDRLAKVTERLKVLERVEDKKKQVEKFTANAELLKALTNIGHERNASQTSESDLGDVIAGTEGHNFVKVSMRKIPESNKTMKESCSMPLLRKSEYPGILESWNAKFSSEKKKTSLKQ